MPYTEEQIAKSAANPAERAAQTERLTLIDDAIAEMESWAWFQDDDEDAFDDIDDLTPHDTDDDDSPDPFPYTPPPHTPSSYIPATPYIAPPKIGRNDPCPCGGGKKFKKCCLAP